MLDCFEPLVGLGVACSWLRQGLTPGYAVQCRDPKESVFGRGISTMYNKLTTERGKGVMMAKP